MAFTEDIQESKLKTKDPKWGGSEPINAIPQQGQIESSPGSPQLPAEEYNRLIATLIEDNEIKDALTRKYNYPNPQKEKVYKSQELVVLAAPA